MQKSVLLFFILTLSIFAALKPTEAAQPSPLPPEAGIESRAQKNHEPAEAPSLEDLLEAPLWADLQPVRLIIPSISLDTVAENVGVNEEGEMDVPDGRTNAVGWYKYGTKPGEAGSAVMDAHVYAAFSKLKYAKVGDDVYVVTKGGNTLHFVIEESLIYKKADVPLDLLFTRSDTKRLNLITCAGRYLPREDTYSERLIVYTKLVENE